MTVTIPRFGVFEWRSDGAADGGVTAQFAFEDGSEQAVAGYGLGEGRAAVRFMPDRAGNWRFRVSTGDAQAAAGSFPCVPSDLHGPVRVDPEHRHHLAHHDGTPFYMMGTTAYNAVSAYRRRREEFYAFLDYHADRGFNWVRFLIEQVTWPLHDEVVWPWGGSPANPDFGRYCDSTFEAAEGVIRACADRGMIASVILLHPGDSFFAALPEKVDICARLARYASARLGAHWNVVWNVANEWMRGYHALVSECDEHEVFALADPGREYVVYAVTGQPFRLNLTHAQGSLEARWYNPRPGTFSEVFVVRIAQDKTALSADEMSDLRRHEAFMRQNVRFEPPEDGGDWVLHVRARDPNSRGGER